VFSLGLRMRLDGNIQPQAGVESLQVTMRPLEVEIIVAIKQF